jgi:hypothetical protein
VGSRSLAIVTCVLTLLSCPAYAWIPEDAVATASALCTHVWTCQAINTTAGSDCSPNWTCDYTVGSYTGVAYKWGGFATPSQFDTKLSVDRLGAVAKPPHL